MSTSALPAHVKAVNRAHTIANHLQPLLQAAVKPWIGKQIYKIDGSLFAKFEKSLDGLLPNDSKVITYRYRSEYSLMWIVKVSEPTGDCGCLYYEASMYIGKVSKGVLESLCDLHHYREDFTVEEVQARRNAYEAAKKALLAATSDLYPFGTGSR